MFLGKFYDSKFDVFILELTGSWGKCENECHHRILRLKWPVKHVSRDTRAIFSYVTSFDLTLIFDLCLALATIRHLYHPFSSTFAQFELAALSDLVSAANKAKRVSFDLWPDFDPTLDLLRTFYECIRIPPLGAFGRRLALLAPPIRSGFRHGGGRNTTPPRKRNVAAGDPNPARVKANLSELAGFPIVRMC